MQVNLPRDERKRMMSSPFVYGPYKNSHEEFSPFSVTAKK